MKHFRLNISTLALLLVITCFSACTKKPEGSISVTTKAVTEITGTSAKTGGSVTSTGYSVGDCGVCYGESHNPSLNNSFTKDHEGDGSFSSTLSNLKSGTKYYVRAYAKMSSGIEYGDETSFTTKGGYTINVFANPTAGGTVTGAGDYQEGQNCTVTATAKTGYIFTNWTENGTGVSSDETYSFTVSGSRNLQANFSQKSYTIAVTANPNEGGYVTGEGDYQHGRSCTVTANPLLGFTFTNWTENGEIVSSEASYSFTVTSDRNLIANFTIVDLVGAWLYYDNDTVDGRWGYANGGTMEWAVMFPSSMLGQYVGMNITAMKVYIGEAGTYYMYFYSGETTPTTEIYSGYCILDDYGLWTITLHTPISVTTDNLWVVVSTTHEAGKYPAGSSVGSNNPNARWINWGSNGWCDAYMAGWTNQDLTWIIRAYVTNGDKSIEIGSSKDEVSSYPYNPFRTRTLQENTKQIERQSPSKQKGVKNE